MRCVLKQLFLSTVLYTAGALLTAAHAAVVCNPSPSTITFANAHSPAQTVNYSCTGAIRPKIGLRFDAASGISVTPANAAPPVSWQPVSNYQITVNATQSGTVKASQYNVGYSWSPDVSGTPLTVIVGTAPKPSVTAGALSCSPTSVTTGGTSTCSIQYTNSGTASATGVTITPSASAGSVGSVSGCASSLAASASCTASFTYTAPSTVPSPNPVTLTTAYQDAQDDVVAGGSASITITAPSHPAVTAGALSCSPTSVTTGGTSTCSIQYTNNGTASATGVTITPSASAGSVGGVSGCASSLAASESCTATFTYTAPSAVPSPNPVTVTTSYQDAQDEVVAGGTSVTITAPAPPLPTVTGILPAEGPTTGNTSVAVTGTNFTGVTAVKFGSNAASSFNVASSTSLTATSPVGTGTVDVTVTTAAGTSATGSADRFTYQVPPPPTEPTVSSISPAIGPTSGGTSVTISGTNLSNPTGVTFGGAAATVNADAANSITVTTPPGTAGAVAVVVTTSGGSATAPQQFTYVQSTGAVTASGIRCYPDPVSLGSSLNCNMLLTNITDSAIPNFSAPTVTVNGASVTPTSSCLSSLQSNVPCLVSFTGTAPSTGASVKIQASPSSTAAFFVDQTATIPIFSSSAPNIQSNPLTCDQTQSPVQCSVLFRNLGTVGVDSVVVTPSVPAGEGTVTPASLTCSHGAATMSNQYDTCTATFTYSPPSTIPAWPSATISVAYQDDHSSYAAFLNPTSVLLGAQNPDVIASVIPNTGNVMPGNSISYSATTPLQVTFKFANTGGPINAKQPPPIVAALVNGQMRDVSSAIDSSSSCVTEGTLPGSPGACTLIVNFLPYDFDGFKIGDQVTLAAWLPLTTGGMSQIGTWNFSIGAPPIFSTVVLSQPFVQDSDTVQTSSLVGISIFGNNSGSTLTDLRFLRDFLPAGFSPSSSATCSTLAQNYTSSTGVAAVPCSTLLASGQYCYACFQANAGYNFSGNNVQFQAQLVSDPSAVLASKTVAVTPSYRILTLNNQCSGTVWPAFVSGAAYNYCTQNSDCPVGSICYTSGHQCQVPPTSSSPCGTSGGGYNVPADFPVHPGACSTGCIDNKGVCPVGSSCNTSNGLCYWNLPLMPSTMSDWTLSSSQTAIVKIPNIPQTAAGDWSTVWSGGLVARTGCDTSKGTCQTAQCNSVDSNFGCKLGTAPSNPYTQAEFTFLYQNQDYYDVEVINGFNIPVSMEPTGYSTTPVVSSPYICNVAGHAVQGLSSPPACTWNFNMQSYDIKNSAAPTPYTAKAQALHTYVSDVAANGDGESCTPGPSACASGKVCGLSQTNSTKISGASAPPFTCGSLIGFWSSNQLCANNPTMEYTDPTPGSTFTLKCDLVPAGDPYNNKLSTWFGCNGGTAQNSCYSSTAAAGCCGCPYWSAGSKSGQKTPSTYFETLFPAGFVLSPNANNDYCVANSSPWITSVMGPSLIWMKQGCSSLYTFAYDDPTSTFTCSSNSVVDGQVQNPAGKVNTQDYTITFCPGGNNGQVNGQPVVVP